MESTNLMDAQEKILNTLSVKQEFDEKYQQWLDKCNETPHIFLKFI